MSGEEMACRELVELITDYLEGAMSPALRASLEAHLAECPGCVLYLEQMRQTMRTLGRLRERDLSADDRGRLLGLFRSWRVDSSPET
jgi:anti-sigma factor RsiW